MSKASPKSAGTSSSSGGLPSRRDARARRQQLIEAAAACFAEKGYTVPLEEIADRAGVGRGTLYRNFRDRMDLALAVFEQDIDLLEMDLVASLPVERVMIDLLLRGANVSALFTRLAIELPLDNDHLDRFYVMGERVKALLQPVVDKAHADGLLRPELDAEDLLLCMRMMSGLLLPLMPENEKRQKLDGALAMLMKGLRAD